MTRALLICVVAAAGLLLAGHVRAAPSTAAIIAEVQSALDKGDAQHAANLADAALKEEAGAADRGRLLLYRGLAQELLGGHAEAMRDFTQALETRALPPDERAQALLQRGFLRDGLGRLDEAVADYSAVIALKGEGLTTALNNRANIYRRQNKLPQARRDYLAALTVSGGRPQYSYYGLGQIAEAQHDTMAARGFYAKAVAADPGYALASERLSTLGGPPDGVIPDAVPVALHPPPVGAPPADARGFRVATEAVKDADGTIVLRAPRPADKDRPVVLRPPRQSQYSAARPPAPTLPPPVRSSRSNGLVLVLRPALDSHVSSDAAEVQLGAWRSEAEARAGWVKAKSRSGDVLDGLSPHVVTADLPGKGRYYRLRVAPAAGQTRAEFCDRLTAQGVTCLPARD